MIAAIISALTSRPPLTGAISAAATALGLTAWRWFGHADDRVDLLIFGAWAMSATGFVCYSLHRYRPDMERALLRALLATPPPQTPHLRAVRVRDLPGGNGSRIASGRESTG